MVVGAARDDVVAPFGETRRHRAGVVDNRLLVLGEGGVERFLEGDGLGGDDMHEGAALRAWKNEGGKLFLDLGVGAGENHPPTRAAERLVGGGGHDVGVRDGVGVETGGDEPGDVGHVDDEMRPHLVGDRTEHRPVQRAGIGRKTRDEKARTVAPGEIADLVIVHESVRGAHAVGDGVVELAGEIHRRPVGQVTAGGKTHAEQRGAGRGECQVDGGVGLRARVRLDVGVVGGEEFAGALDGEPLGDVHVMAPAVVAAAGVPFGVLVREHRTLGGEDVRAGVVLRRDELEHLFLPSSLALEGGGEFGVERREGRGAVVTGTGGGQRFAPADARGYSSSRRPAPAARAFRSPLP
jgi:hypothetical protein